MEITYRQEGDYLIPNIGLSKEKERGPIGKYGMLRKQYLQNHKKIEYQRLLMTEELYPHLAEIDEAAQERLDVMMEQLARQNPPPDKATDQMGWVGHMNNLKAMAEEVILNELIYT